jgi:hypothetical protein
MNYYSILDRESDSCPLYGEPPRGLHSYNVVCLFVIRQRIRFNRSLDNAEYPPWSADPHLRILLDTDNR